MGGRRACCVHGPSRECTGVPRPGPPSPRHRSQGPRRALGEAAVDDDQVCGASALLLEPVQGTAVGSVQGRAGPRQQQVGKVAVEEHGAPEQHAQHRHAGRHLVHDHDVRPVAGPAAAGARGSRCASGDGDGRRARRGRGDPGASTVRAAPRAPSSTSPPPLALRRAPPLPRAVQARGPRRTARP